MSSKAALMSAVKKVQLTTMVFWPISLGFKALGFRVQGSGGEGQRTLRASSLPSSMSSKAALMSTVKKVRLTTMVFWALLIGFKL